jgi:hypothetical protein
MSEHMIIVRRFHVSWQQFGALVPERLPVGL